MSERMAGWWLLAVGLALTIFLGAGWQDQLTGVLRSSSPGWGDLVFLSGLVLFAVTFVIYGLDLLRAPGWVSGLAAGLGALGVGLVALVAWPVIDDAKIAHEKFSKGLVAREIALIRQDWRVAWSKRVELDQWARAEREAPAVVALAQDVLGPDHDALRVYIEHGLMRPVDRMAVARAVKHSDHPSAKTFYARVFARWHNENELVE